MDISFFRLRYLRNKKTVAYLFLNITTSVGDFDKFSYFQEAVDGSQVQRDIFRKLQQLVMFCLSVDNLVFQKESLLSVEEYRCNKLFLQAFAEIKFPRI